MFATILFLVSSLAFLGSFTIMLYMKYRDAKTLGPFPWHPGYDMAREERVMREEMINRSKEKTQVNIKGLDEYLT